MVLAGISDGCGATTHAELFEDLVNMPFSGGQGDQQLVSQLLVAQASSNQAQNFEFPICQRIDQA